MPSGPETDWDLFQSLHAVLEEGSLSAAARRRGMTQPTIGRHIEALEQRLGAPLFLRSPRGLQPTDLALEMQPRLEDMAAAVASALRDVTGAGGQTSGVVRLTATESVGVEILPPILAEFHRRHPGIVVELTVSNRHADLTRRDADIAVRMGRPTQNSLVARKVGVVHLGLYATEDYAARNGLPTTVEELDQHAIVGFDGVPPPLQGKIDIGRPITREIFTFRSDSDMAQLAALRAGFGIGACQRVVAARYGLLPVLDAEFNIEMEMWLCMPEGLRMTPRMRLMFDHLAEGLKACIQDPATTTKNGRP